ncbi:hypothetical protein [Arenimonas sp. MALMAid1274]|uniref:hypothetical protein n=1 Tax=Arenimonas sp. MALMAid1274 TaxID=3411630 RepID=UPI003BA00BE4
MSSPPGRYARAAACGRPPLRLPRYSLPALLLAPAAAHASDPLADWQWIALVAMVTSVFAILVYALSAALFLRLIRLGKLASPRLAHAVPMAVFGAYVLLRVLSGSLQDGVVVAGVLVGWLCAAAPYTLLVQWYWAKRQAELGHDG